jgi:hypothetical protein
MRECRTYGSVRGALSNERPYRDPLAQRLNATAPFLDSTILALWSDQIENLTGGAVPFTIKRLTRKRESVDERQTSHADGATPDR